MNDQLPPSVTYIVPTLNSEKTLDLTLYSLQSQEKIKIEIIVVDSGSQDKTLEICKRWQIKTLFAQAGNIYHAINLGLGQSKSDWLGYLNSDDWLYSNSVYRLVTEGERQKADFIYGKCDYTDERGRFLFSYTPAHPSQILSIFKRGIFPLDQQACLFRRSLYEQLQGFDETYKIVADADFVIRALEKKAKFAILSKSSVACFRQHPQQLSKRELGINLAERQSVRQDLAPTNLRDYITMLRWRLGNLPQYMIRFLRPSLLCDRWHFAGVNYEEENKISYTKKHNL
ncbi:MAG: glycosyltransferase [Microcystaceae cyanobacterium]